MSAAQNEETIVMNEEIGKKNEKSGAQQREREKRLETREISRPESAQGEGRFRGGGGDLRFLRNASGLSLRNDTGFDSQRLFQARSALLSF